MSAELLTKPFFEELQRRLAAEASEFEKLGYFDTIFGVHVLPDKESDERLFVLDFDLYSCRGIREASPEDAGDVDFVLAAPYGVWREALTSVDDKGRIDAAHSINTLTHHGEPMSVTSSSPEGHDKLFRFAESIQLVFDVAGRVATA